MIVKIKHIAIDKLVADKQSNGKPRKRYYSVNNSNNRNTSTGMPEDSGVDDNTDEERDTAPLMGNDDENSDDIFGNDSGIDDNAREHMFKHMTYGDIGKLSFGKWGVGLVNFCIALTQFGFCVGYSIFIGNTIHSLFLPDLCYKKNGTDICSPFTATTKLHVKRSINDSVFVPTLPNVPLNNTSQASYMDFNEDLNKDFSSLMTTLPSALFSSSKEPNVTSRTTQSPNGTTLSPNGTDADFLRRVVDKAPDLKILVAAPLPVFLCFALIRSVRYLGFISMLANASILVGLVALTGFLISGKTGCFISGTV